MMIVFQPRRRKDSARHVAVQRRDRDKNEFSCLPSHSKKSHFESLFDTPSGAPDEIYRARSLQSTATGEMLEVKESDPMLEVSHLTEDSYFLAGLAQSQKETAPATPETTTQSKKKKFFSFCLETPRKLRQAFIKRVGTPETIMMEDESSNGGIDDLSNDRKFQRRILSEISIRIDDYDDAGFDKLLCRLSGNKDLTHVDLYRFNKAYNRRNRTHEEMRLLFGVIKSLPNIKEVSLHCFNRFDLEAVCFFILKHTTLQVFHLHLVSGTVDSRLLNAMAELPALERLSLDVQFSFPLHILLSSKSLVEFTVCAETFQFDERHLVLAMNALEKNERLQILDLKPQLTASDVRLLSFGIRLNTHLERVRFSFLADEDNAGSALLHLSNAVVQNKSLLSVENHYSQLLRINAVDTHRISNILSYHSSLKTFDLHNNENFIEPRSLSEGMPDPECSGGLFSRLSCHSEVPFEIPDHILKHLSPDEISRQFQQSWDNLISSLKS